MPRTRKLTEAERQALAGVHVSRALERLRADPGVAAEVHYPENWPGGVVEYLARRAHERAWEESSYDASPFTLSQARRAARVIKLEAVGVCAAAAAREGSN